MSKFFKNTTIKEKTNKEIWEHCKRVSEELAEIDNNVYRCPYCDKFIKWDNDQYNDDEAWYTCPECGEEFDESDLKAVWLWDYFNCDREY